MGRMGLERARADLRQISMPRQSVAKSVFTPPLGSRAASNRGLSGRQRAARETQKLAAAATPRPRRLDRPSRAEER